MSPNVLTPTNRLATTSAKNTVRGFFGAIREAAFIPIEDLPPDMVASLIPAQEASEYLPPGFRLGEAFTLPFDLESIQCQPGTVKVRQRATAK